MASRKGGMFGRSLPEGTTAGHSLAIDVNGLKENFGLTDEHIAILSVVVPGKIRYPNMNGIANALGKNELEIVCAVCCLVDMRLLLYNAVPQKPNLYRANILC
jgi:hypothetical protein